MAQITLNSTGVASNGALVLQSNGTTTAVTVSTGQVATLVNDAVVNGVTVGRGAGAVSTNTAVGASAIAATATATRSTAIGFEALKALTSGDPNTAVGAYALNKNTTGAANVGVGAYALEDNTTGSSNSALGNEALANNTTGSSCVAVGASALLSNTTAINNTAVGYQAGYSQTTTGYGTFLGQTAGYATTGISNTFVGQQAGALITSGAKNTIIGRYDGNQGSLDIRTASNYIVLSDGDGNPNLYLDNNKDLFVPKVYVSTTASAANVFVTSAGQIIRSNPSSARFKENITDWSGNGLEEILKLKPRTFTYKASHYSQPERSFLGLIAEEVATVSSYLVDYENEDGTGQIENVRYANIVVPLVKAIQELKAEFDAYKATHP